MVSYCVPTVRRSDMLHPKSEPLVYSSEPYPHACDEDVRRAFLAGLPRLSRAVDTGMRAGFSPVSPDRKYPAERTVAASVRGSAFRTVAVERSGRRRNKESAHGADTLNRCAPHRTRFPSRRFK